MNRQKLIDQIKSKKSFLCVGLDTDVSKIPAHIDRKSDYIFEFNKSIIDATNDLCVSYKLNSAFYEAAGEEGMQAMWKTVVYCKETYPDHFIIADAKRGDIGNTCDMYAKAFFDEMNFDAITLAPYMGKDSVESFLKYKDKWSIVLALTSNKSAEDFETLTIIDKDGKQMKLYEKVVEESMRWGNSGNMMYVVGATRAETLGEIRKIIPDHFLLVPGVGAQGGSLQEVCKYGLDKDCGLLVNASRSIIYASSGTDFAEKAREESAKMQKEMSQILNQSPIFNS